MKIGIDFDGTISADPQAFGIVVAGFLFYDHKCAIVTWRKPPEGGGVDADIQEVFSM